MRRRADDPVPAVLTVDDCPTYARHVGRIGTLAVALGIGAAVTLGTGAGSAHAEGTEPSGSGGADSSQTQNSPSPAAESNASSQSVADDSTTAGPASNSGGTEATKSEPQAPDDDGLSEAKQAELDEKAAAAAVLDESDRVSDRVLRTQVAVDDDITEARIQEVTEVEDAAEVVVPVLEAAEPAGVTTVLTPEDPTPAAPVDSPLEWTLLAVARREATAKENTVPGVVTKPDVYKVAPDTKLAVDAKSGVLANDAGSNGTPLVAAIAQRPNFGEFELYGDGSFVYVPKVGFVGTDQFVYAAVDTTTGEAVWQTVTLFVAKEADMPPVAKDDVITAFSGDTVKFDVLANDTDPEGRALTVQLIGKPRLGQASLAADGTLTYTPAEGAEGTDVLTYRVSDGVNTADATVTIQVASRTPVAVNDTAVAYGEESVRIDVLANDHDPTGGKIRVSVSTKPSNGVLEYTDRGIFVYRADAGFVGVDTFTYTLDDGSGNVSTATVTVSVRLPNKAPVAKDDDATTFAYTPVSIDALANDYDPEGGPLTIKIDKPPIGGTVVVGPKGQLVYTPKPGFVGKDVITYVVIDKDGRPSTATVYISVGETKGAPKAVENGYSVGADRTLTVSAPQGILTNDDDPDGDELSAVVTEMPGNGTLSVNDDGSFIYTPRAGFTGVDSFTYQAFDGTARSAPVTVTIVVEPGVPETIVLAGGQFASMCADNWWPEAKMYESHLWYYCDRWPKDEEPQAVDADTADAGAQPI